MYMKNFLKSPNEWKINFNQLSTMDIPAN